MNILNKVKDFNEQRVKNKELKRKAVDLDQALSLEDGQLVKATGTVTVLISDKIPMKLELCTVKNNPIKVNYYPAQFCTRHLLKEKDKITVYGVYYKVNPITGSPYIASTIISRF